MQGKDEVRHRLLQFQVPCGHAAVAQQACPARARESGPSKTILELLVCPYLQNLLNLQVRSRPGLPGELRPAAPRRLRLIVGTDLLAYVAPKGPVTHFRTEVAGDLPPILDREVRDTEPGVHDAGRLYGAGGAPVHATRTASAGSLAGRIGVEVEVHDQVRYKEVRPISLFIRQEFRPKKPSPACWAAERSRSGTASVKPRARILTPSSSSSSSLSRNSLPFMTSW